MAIRTSVLFLLALCALIPAGADEARKVVVQGKRDPSEIVIRGVRDPSPWFRVESPHLIVYSDDDPDQAIELVNNLERLDTMLRLYFKPFLVDGEPGPRLTVYFQRQVAWQRELGPDLDTDVSGMVDSCAAADQMFAFDLGRIWKLDNAALLKHESDRALSSAMFMYAENFLYRHTDIRAPWWFVNGIGAYFGGVRFSDTHMAVGRAGGASYDVLKSIDAHAYTDRTSILPYLSFEDVLRGDLDWDRLAAFKHRKSQPVENAKQGEFVSRAYNLAHFMLSTAEHRDKMAAYLELVNGGRNGADAFADVFGLSGRAVDTAMWRYRQASIKILEIDVPDLPAPAVEVTRLSRLEGDFVLDNATLKGCPTPGGGRAVLERVRAKAAAAPAVDFGQRTLSRAQVEWGDPRAAIPYLKRAAQDAPYDPEPHYLLGLAYAKLAQGAGADADRQDLLAAARARLDQAAVLAPEAPEVAYARFRTALLGEQPTEQDMTGAIEAWRRGHDVTAFARAAALAYAWKGDAANAYRAFNSLARSVGKPEDAQWATRWLARLEQGVARDELLAAMRSETPSHPGFDIGVFWD